jgi:hypothetical protein
VSPEENQPLVFRAPLSLRWILGVAGAGCAIVAGAQIVAFLTSGDVRHLGAAVALLLPGVLVFMVSRRRVIVAAEELRSRTLFHERVIPWSAIRRLDKTRGAFIVETSHGPVSAGWLAAHEREQLMRLIIEHAKLVAAMSEPRFGILASYLPRAKDIGFVPLARRREQSQRPES